MAVVVVMVETVVGAVVGGVECYLYRSKARRCGEQPRRARAATHAAGVQPRPSARVTPF